MPKVVDTQSWLPHQLDPYWPEIFAAMMKLKAKLPDDISYSVLIAMWANGRRKLWLILDDDGGFLAFAMTEVETNLATGRQQLVLKDCAGEGVILARDALCEALETFAASEGITDTRINGLLPWAKVTKPLGYDIHSVMLRKTVER